MESSQKPKIVVIVGQTGSGKTALSLELARAFSGEVINADSRQVYAGLDIGTEKITKEEMGEIPHHLLSVISPQEVYTAQQFSTDAAECIEKIVSGNKLPIVAGGTFFYIDTLLGKMQAPEIEPDFALRKQLEERDTESLFAELQEKDPVRAQTIDPHNKRRIMRALEILNVLPSVPQLAPKENPYETFTIGLAVDKNLLKERLRARALRALEKGLITETKSLIENGLTRERLSEIGLEYRLVLEYLDGSISEEALVQKLSEKNWQYAKRQMVWLKRDTSIQWYTPDRIEDIKDVVSHFLKT